MVPCLVIVLRKVSLKKAKRKSCPCLPSPNSKEHSVERCFCLEKESALVQTHCRNNQSVWTELPSACPKAHTCGESILCFHIRVIFHPSLQPLTESKTLAMQRNQERNLRTTPWSSEPGYHTQTQHLNKARILHPSQSAHRWGL